MLERRGQTTLYELIVKMKNEIKPTLPGMEELIHSPKVINKSKKIKTTEDTPLKIEKNDHVDCVSNLKEEARINIGIEDIFGLAYEQLNLLDSIETGYKLDESNDLLKKLVLSRLHNPTSKNKSVKELKKHYNEDVHVDTIYRLMDKVYENIDGIKKKILSTTLGLFQEKVDVAFFDVTTLYFESFIPDELRHAGFSKDNKFKETQVMLALITTVDGLPLGYELFPGNTYEGNTLIKVVDELQKNYDLRNTFIVADRAMFSRQNLDALDEKSVKFIVAAKLKTLKSDLKNQIITTVQTGIKNYPEQHSFNFDLDYEGRRLVVSYCQKRADKDLKDRERLVDRIKKKMKNDKVALADLINNTGTKKYLKIDRLNKKEATLNFEKIEEDSLWDGIHGVITNHKSEELNTLEVLKNYKNLWQIEAAFRVNKNDLKMRPIFHWNARRIKAHILICFLSYTLATQVRYKLKQLGLKISFDALREELSQMQASILKEEKSGRKYIMPSKVTETQRAIYRAFDLSINEKTRLLR